MRNVSSSYGRKQDRAAGGRARSRATAPSAAAVVEGLENRLFCDNTFGAAVALGTINGLVVRLNKVDAADQKDFYKLTTPLAGRLRVTLDNITGGGGPDLYLYNAANVGAQIGSSTLSGSTSEVIDKSSVPAGTYYVEVRRNTGTANYTLGVQTDYAGSNIATARATGAVGAAEKVMKDFVGNSDTQDFYRFNTTANGVVTLKLDGLTSDVDLQLFSSTGTLLKLSVSTGSTAELIYHGSSAATYYARVYQFSSSSNYTLRLSNAAVPADNAGNTLAAARNLGTVGSTKTFNDWVVNNFDHDDFYKFFVAEPGNIVVNLSGLKANLDVDIRDNLGNVVARSTKTSTANESITLKSNLGGTYFVRVYQGGTTGASGATSPYTLGITAPADTAGNTRANAKALTLVGGAATVDGFVGLNDLNDWYKVTIASGKTLRGTISDLSSDADLELYNSAGMRLAQSSKGNRMIDTVEAGPLAAGTYFFRVFFTASYRLTVRTL